MIQRIVRTGKTDSHVDDLLDKMFMVRAPSILRFADGDFDDAGTPINIVEGRATKTDLTFLDTFGMRLREIVNAASDGYLIYLIRKTDGQVLFDTLEEYLTRSTKGFEMNRATMDQEFRTKVQNFANVMVTISNAKMLKNNAMEKFGSTINLIDAKAKTLERMDDISRGDKPRRRGASVVSYY